ncbi:MAG: hypothetical protein K2F58_04810, partial [Muribaculaceae bacterium]|nr:hypothetical protein [Muribaculaceae bacterium]
NITSITRLDDIKGRIIRGITLRLTTDTLTQTLVNLLREHSEAYTSDRGELRISLYDPKLNRAVNLTAQRPIAINKELISLLDGENITYSINKQ